MKLSLYKKIDFIKFWKKDFKDGPTHRLHGWACCRNKNRVSKCFKHWFENDKSHRLDGPALIVFHDERTIREYCVNGYILYGQEIK